MEDCTVVQVCDCALCRGGLCGRLSVAVGQGFFWGVAFSGLGCVLRALRFGWWAVVWLSGGQQRPGPAAVLLRVRLGDLRLGGSAGQVRRDRTWRW